MPTAVSERRYNELTESSCLEGEITSVNNTKSPMMKGLIGRAGDKSKNNDRLKFALVGVRFPQAYDEQS